eukprot:1161773-Pelagomonas_calceolata.AAC.31
MEGAIHMMTFWERIYEASGCFEVDHMLLVVEGACARKGVRTFDSRHVSMHGVESIVVVGAVQLPICFWWGFPGWTRRGPRPGVPKNTGDWGFCMVKQTVPPHEPPKTEVVPGSSPFCQKVFVKPFTPRMTPFLNQRLGCLPLV